MISSDTLIKYEKISEVTDMEFALVIGNVVRRIGNAFIISPEHLAYQNIPEDGIYYLSPATCDNSCSVGIPKPDCVEKGIYSKDKCSVYFLRKPDTVHITIEQLLELME